MGKLTVFLMVLASLVSGCTFSYEVLTPVPAVTDSELTPYNTPIATLQISLPVATTTPTAVQVAPTLAPPTTDPIFFNGRSAATQEDHLTRQSSFPAGTKIVYVIWDYDNMRAGMNIRREWYLNGQPWLVRDAAWDFAKYGSTGSMRDVSIYDEANGLDAGVYHLRIYIDNVVQPLGSLFYNPIHEWMTFEIAPRAEESFMGYGSWDGQWGVEVYGGTRVVLKNAVTGESKPVVNVQEVAYVSWFKDGKHFLFVDRDRSEQIPRTNIGIRDHLWIVDVPGGAARRIYKGDESFKGTGGPAPSPDGKYIASLEGSGFGDACVVDLHLIFFELSGDFNSVKSIKQQEFSGVPAFNEGWVYPLEDGFWESDSSYHVTLDGTCNADRSQLGNFRFNLPNRSAAQVPSSTGQSAPADLGLGMVYGTVTDVNGAPIVNATLTCEHHSYKPVSLCSGSLRTDANGGYVFTDVFFHDTDTIRLIAQAVGYETQEISRSFFTVNDWRANVVLNKTP